jgi:hypothetical protein
MAVLKRLKYAAQPEAFNAEQQTPEKESRLQGKPPLQ